MEGDVREVEVWSHDEQAGVGVFLIKEGFSGKCDDTLMKQPTK